MRIAGLRLGSLGGKNRIPPELTSELPIPRTKLEWVAEPVAVAAIIAQIVLLAVQYTALPESVPTHFGANGQPNAFGSRDTVLFLVGGNILLYVMLTVMAAFPRFYSFSVAITPQNFRRQYLLVRGMVLALKVLVCWMFCYLTYQIMAVALGQAQGLGFGMWVFMILIIGVLPPVLILSYKWR